MNTQKSSLKLALVGAAGLLASSISAQAIVLTVSPNGGDVFWVGYMVQFHTPENGGQYISGDVISTADLRASFSGPVLSLSPNTTNFGADRYFEANMYRESSAWTGQTVTFEFQVLSLAIAEPYLSSAVAFIKDFAPDYSSNVTQTIPLALGFNTLTLNTINDPARHIQVGFMIKGPAISPTDTTKGSIEIVPEPSSMALLIGGIASLGLARRRKS